MDLIPLAYTLTGIGVYVQQLISAIHRTDPALKIAYPTHCELPIPALLKALISRNLDRGDVQKLDVQPRFGFSPFGPFRHYGSSELACDGCDLYHVTSTVSKYRTYRCPTVVSVYDLADLRLDGKDSGSYEWLLPQIRAARVNLCISQVTQRDVIELLDVPEERTMVTPLAPRPLFVPPSSDLQRGLCRARLNGGNPYFLAVSTIEPRKNYVRMVEAFSLLRERGCDHQLIIAGAKRSAWPEVKAKIDSLGIANAVQVLGWVSNQRLLELMWGATALLYPSLYEGFGLPIVEAMATGTPVVASNAGSIPEVVGDAMPMVDAYSVESIAEGMERAREDSESLELRSRLKAQAAKFSWDQTASRTIDAYQRALET